MAKIVFVDSTGMFKTVNAKSGISVMEAAVKAGVHAIVAECGGACACATCHVYVDAEWQNRLAPPSSIEEGMLEFVSERRSGSRLSCQIVVQDDLDGLLMHTPAQQG